MPVFGLNNGMVPIIAYNYGAKKPERVHKTVKLSVATAMSIMAVGTLVFEVFPGQLLQLFEASPEMLSIGIPALRLIGLSFIMAGHNIPAAAVCQAIGNPMHSLVVSVCRQLVVLLPVAWLLSQTGNLTLVWLAFPISEVVALVMSAVYLKKALRSADAVMASGEAA